MLAPLREYLPGEGEITGLTRVEESQPAIAILKVAKQEYVISVRKATQEGCICDEDFRRDMRYHLGRASMAEDLLGLPQAAKEWVKQQEQGDER